MKIMLFTIIVFILLVKAEDSTNVSNSINDEVLTRTAIDCLTTDYGISQENLNKFKEYKEAENEYYIGNAIESKIIIIGQTISKEKSVNQEDFKLEIIEVIKGKEILTEKYGGIPKYIIYSDYGFFWSEPEPVLNIMGIYYLLTKDEQKFDKITGSTVLFDKGNIIYETYYRRIKSRILNIFETIHDERWAKSKEWRVKQKSIFRQGILNISWDEALKNIKKTLLPWQ